ncbi:hypothetical protein OF829_12995 [Sphingomonas sp. LB-2]|uniref:hypothetical protein n=1 Tax=Sphingomonas caeni TaxID=2984949 RepID=UPI00222F9C24|nr:hypothetical protein [Sphingomonas caeni]MCW3848158.1 hypothetical protein [Sphingomonas caeni]
MRFKAFRWLGLLALPLLVASAAPRISIYPMPETLVPNQDVKLREAFTARPGDILMRARITATERAFLDDPAEVKADRFTDSIPVGGELTPVIAPESTDAVMGGNGKYYCGENQRGRSALRSLLLGGIGAKFEAIVRFCFIDADGDRKFERYFLAGAKDKAMQAPIAIPVPIRYHSTWLDQLHPGDLVQIRYRKFNPKNRKVELELEVMRDGRKAPFDYILWSKPGTESLAREVPRLTTNPAKLPYPVVFSDVLGAAIAVKDVTPDGTATFAINRNFRRTLFRPISIQVNYVYIYI